MMLLHEIVRCDRAYRDSDGSNGTAKDAKWIFPLFIMQCTVIL